MAGFNRILIIGDSITYGAYATLFANTFYRLVEADNPGATMISPNVTNYNLPYATVNGWATHKNSNPDLIIFELGLNDAIKFGPLVNTIPEQFWQANYESLLAEAVATGARVVAVTPFAARLPNHPEFAIIERYAGYIRNASVNVSGVLLADAYQLTLNCPSCFSRPGEISEIAPGYTGDNFHPGDFGHAVIAASILNVLIKGDDAMPCENLACIGADGCVDAFSACANGQIPVRVNGQWVCGNANEIGITDPGNCLPANVSNVNAALQYLCSGASVCAGLGACSINALGDVNIAGATANKYLMFNGTQWVAVNKPDLRILSTDSTTIPTFLYPYPAAGVRVSIAEFDLSWPMSEARHVRYHFDGHMQSSTGYTLDNALSVVAEMVVDGNVVASETSRMILRTDDPFAPGTNFSFEFHEDLGVSNHSYQVRLYFNYANGVPTASFRFFSWHMNVGWVE